MSLVLMYSAAPTDSCSGGRILFVGSTIDTALVRRGQFLVGRRRFGPLLHVVVAVLVALVAVCGLPQQAHAKRDAVERAIRKSVKPGGITASERRQFLKQWRASGRTARRLRRSGKTSRATEIENVRTITLRMARKRRLTPDRIRPAMANVRATTYVFSKRPFPRHYQRIQVPFDEVVFGYYSGSGMQFQPLFTFSHANTLYRQKKNDELVALAQRLRELATTRRHSVAWEYYFPWQGGSPPWTSAMSQAVSLEVLSRTAEVTQDPSWVVLGERVLDGFGRNARNGGVSDPVGAERWYPLYAYNPRQRVLNGHLQALLGLEYWARTTGSTEARTRLEEGTPLALRSLPKFDTGAWSRYQPGQEATLDYHDLMTTQLERLGRRLPNETFEEYAGRFWTYRITPPALRVTSASQSSFYPWPRDGWRDGTWMNYRVNKRATLTFRIQTPGGRTVRSIRDSQSTGTHRLSWDGRTSSGRPAAAGEYIVKVTATDIVGNRQTVQLGETLTVVRDTTDPTVTNLTVKKKGSRTIITCTVNDAESPRVLGQIISRRKVRASMRGKRRLRLVVMGKNFKPSRARIVVTDTSGNSTSIRLR